MPLVITRCGGVLLVLGGFLSDRVIADSLGTALVSAKGNQLTPTEYGIVRV